MRPTIFDAYGSVYPRSLQQKIIENACNPPDENERDCKDFMGEFIKAAMYDPHRKSVRQKKHKKKPKINYYKSLLERFHLEKRLELKGDPSKGKILFYRQAHVIPPELLDSSVTTKELKIIKFLASVSQFIILKDLNEKKAKHLFLEGLGDDISGEKLVLSLMKHYLPELTTLAKPLTGREWWGEEQLIALSYLGAGVLFGAINPEVFLYKTISTQVHKNIILEALSLSGGAGKINLDDPKVKRLIMNKREELATREMIKFLKANPGAEIVLIYGGLHQFCDDFIKQGFRPSITSLLLYDNSGSIFSDSLPKSCVPEESGNKDPRVERPSYSTSELIREVYGEAGFQDSMGR